jgi:lysophospholipase L1-like esterase
MKKELFILGDSISIHYTPILRSFLGPEWKIIRKGDIPAPEIPGEYDRENGSDSGVVLNYLKAVISEIEPENILLNAGLHDIKRQPTPNDICQVSLKTYCSNLQKILDFLQSAGKNIFWVTLTPVDDEQHRLYETEFFRRNEDVKIYNEASLEVMKQNKIKTFDLGMFTSRLNQPLYIDHVHFFENVRALQAAYLAGSLNLLVDSR